MKIIRISKMYCNSYIVIDGETGIIVDTLFPGAEKVIIEKIKELGIYSFEPRAIFLTHAHFDHTGSAKVLADFFHIPIISHRLAKPYLEKGENAPLFPYKIRGRLVVFGAGLINSKYDAISPDVVFDSIIDLSQFGINGYILYTPGHTVGSSTLKVGKDVFIGDLLMGFPLFFLPSYPISVTSTKELRKSIEKLVMGGAERFYPGHGIPWEVERVKRLVRDDERGVERAILMN